MVSLTAQKTNLMFSESEGDRRLEFVEIQTCGACEMRIDNFLSVWIQVHKHPKYKLSSCNSVSLGTYNEIQSLNIGVDLNKYAQYMSYSGVGIGIFLSSIY